MDGHGTGEAATAATPVRLLAGAVLIGVGLGGFFDGIVLHQILQWHHMLSDADVPPDSLENLRLNVLADGLFHAAAWVFTLAGVLLLWSGMRATPASRPATTLLAGGMLTGWGAFNLVEGTINHHLLGLHHVRPGPHEAIYDAGFLVWGGAMLLIGVVVLVRSARRRSAIEPGH